MARNTQVSAFLQERSSALQKSRAWGRRGGKEAHSSVPQCFHRQDSASHAFTDRILLIPNSPLCRELNNTSSYDEAFDVMELLDACVVMVVTRVSEERAQRYRSHLLPVLPRCLWRINSFPGQGPTSQPRGSIWRHDLIVVLLGAPCKSQRWFKSCAKSRAVSSPDWRQDQSFLQWHSAPAFSRAVHNHHHLLTNARPGVEQGKRGHPT